MKTIREQDKWEVTRRLESFNSRIDAPLKPQSRTSEINDTWTRLKKLPFLRSELPILN